MMREFLSMPTIMRNLTDQIVSIEKFGGNLEWGDAKVTIEVNCSSTATIRTLKVPTRCFWSPWQRLYSAAFTEYEDELFSSAFSPA
ncbi:hypothetical protein CDAR_484621 [Caerostris darwini]|uniref:Uncharacterized protein n=1 Tax=Caerostris darwini TaxID=1538125 RepID=A0AAV4X4Z7_9ARAC|nr:hypothetical protein CDAR_484621 [Caerostris darwini]